MKISMTILQLTTTSITPDLQAPLSH